MPIQLIKKCYYKLRKFNYIYVKGNREFQLKKKLPHSWYGNNYGGFFVADAALSKECIVYSFGVGEDVSFDTAIHKESGCEVFLFDPTPKSINWVQHQQLPHQLHFYPYGIAATSGEVDFFLPANPNHVSGSFINQNNVDASRKVRVPMRSLPDIMQELGHSAIDILKMDIEGGEYEVLPSILSSGIPVRQILIEFHSRFFPGGKEKTRNMIELLNAHGYQLFGVSDSLEEASFIKG